MGDFLNEYVQDLQGLHALAGGAIALLVIFSVLYNHWMSDLGDKKDGYIAIFVAIGNAFTLLIVSVFSWKAAALVLIAFIASGTAMILGDVYRSVSRRQASSPKHWQKLKRLHVASHCLMSQVV